MEKRGAHKRGRPFLRDKLKSVFNCDIAKEKEWAGFLKKSKEACIIEEEIKKGAVL